MKDMKELNRGMYLRVWRWMFDLGIGGNELLVFAEVYAFSMGGRGMYKMALGTIARRLNMGKRTIYSVLGRLKERGFVVEGVGLWKVDEGGVRRKLGVAELAFGDAETAGICAEMACIEDIRENNKMTSSVDVVETEGDDEFNFEAFKVWWNRECRHLPPIRDFSERQKERLRKLHRIRSVFETSRVFMKANDNYYLSGRSKGAHCPVSLDKLLDEDFFRAVESGKYDKNGSDNSRARAKVDALREREREYEERVDRLKKEVYEEMLARGEGLDSEERLAWWEGEVRRRIIDN